MKKIYSVIILLISIINFFVILNVEDMQSFNELKNFEVIDSSKKIRVDRIGQNGISDEELYNILTETANKYSASIYYTTVSYINDEAVISKYTYSNEEFNDNVKLISGKMININNKENEFIATFDTGDENQIGTIYDFRKNNKLKILPLENGFEKIDFTGDYIVNLKIPQEFDNFITSLNDNNISVTEDVISVNVQANVVSVYMIIAVLYLIIFLIVTYRAVSSYKEIGVKKLLGYTTFDIWIENTKFFLIIQIIIQSIINILLSMIFVKVYSVYLYTFLTKICINFIIGLLISFVLLSIPYIFISKITISNMIKNINSIKAASKFNFVFKIVIVIVFLFLASNFFKEYYSIKSYYSSSLKKWEETINYGYIGGVKARDYEEYTSEAFNLRLKNLYISLNKEGAILADFYSLKEENIKANNNSPIPEAVKYQVTVNPNYLVKNKLYDYENNQINIEEDETSTILIIPLKYKSDEGDIREYFKFLNNDIKIIWSKNEQSMFSYNLDVNPDNGNYVEDPMFSVLTEKNGQLHDYSMVAGYWGNPFKIKVDDSTNLKNEIIRKSGEFELQDNVVNIYSVYEKVSLNIYDLKLKILIIFMGILSCILIMFLILIQSVLTYFEQNKYFICLKTLNGYTNYDRYNDYYKKLVCFWVIISIFSDSIGNVALKVSLCLGILELVISIIIIKTIEKRNIIKILKRG